MNNSKVTNNNITKAKLDKYFALTNAAFKMAKVKKDLSKKEQKKCEQFLDFCIRYVTDAEHFKEKGDYVTAFAALNYAHAWLDAAAVAGWLTITHKDRNKYFTID